MDEKGVLISIHFALFVFDLGTIALTILVDPKFSSLSIPLAAAHAYFPNPFKP